MRVCVHVSKGRLAFFLWWELSTWSVNSRHRRKLHLLLGLYIVPDGKVPFLYGHDLMVSPSCFCQTWTSNMKPFRRLLQTGGATQCCLDWTPSCLQNPSQFADLMLHLHSWSCIVQVERAVTSLESASTSFANMMALMQCSPEYHTQSGSPAQVHVVKCNVIL